MVLGASMMEDPGAAALAEAVRRTRRGGAGRGVLLLHLSAVQAAQPHHARVARALMGSVAERHEGEVLHMAGGDLAVLCRHDPGRMDARGVLADGPDGLGPVLARLFGAARVATGAELVSRYALPRDAMALEAWLTGRGGVARGPLATAGVGAARPADPLGDVSRLLDFPAGRRLMRRQTGVLIGPGLGGGRRLVPSFQEVTVSMAALEQRADARGQATADPLVFRHLVSQLDGRLLAALAAAVAAGEDAGGMTDPVGAPRLALHVNLALDGILSDGMVTLARACAATGRALGVELSLVEVCEAPEAFARAAARLRALEVELVLDGVSAAALAMSRPMALGANTIKLDWQAALETASAAAQARLREALAAAGTGRVILQRAESEAAIGWGLGQGITRFQGRHVDAMLAAQRITGCAHAAGCALRECMDRAAAADGAGRAGCHAPALLDALPLRAAPAREVPAGWMLGGEARL